MPSRIYQRLSAMPELYEENYRRLLHLFPFIGNGEDGQTFTPANLSGLTITIVKCCKYTTVIRIDHTLANAVPLVHDMEMTLRIYHDAAMAEVIHFQGQANIQAVNGYPNRKMHQPMEKSAVNLFLREWLRHNSEIRRARQPSPSRSAL